MNHVPPVMVNEAIKFGLEWVRKKFFRSKELPNETALSKENELVIENELLKAQVDSKRAFERLMAEMVYIDGAYWKKDGSGPYCKVCLLKDQVEMPLDEGATRGVYACPVHETSYWSSEYRERRANRPVRFRSWSKQRAYLEAQSRRRAGY
jgi:hypothetical protein